METAKSVGEILLFLVIGVFAIGWQIVEYKEKMGWTIIWIGIIPLPVGLVGVLSAVGSVVMSIQLYNSTHP
jgi:hypothetical protein